MPTTKKAETVLDVTKVGNLVDDPNLFFSASGVTVCRFRIAVNTPAETKDDGTPNWQGEMSADYYDVTCFATLANNVSESLSKGDRVLVNGRPELHEYEGSDGETHTSKAIVANNVGPELRFAHATVIKPQRIAVNAKSVSADERF